MAKVNERNKKLLLILVLVLSAALYYRLNNPFKQESVSMLTYTGENGKTVAKKIPKATYKTRTGKSGVMLGAFLKPEPVSGAVSNNIFYRTAVVPAVDQIKSEDLERIREGEREVNLLEQLYRELAVYRVIGAYKSRGHHAVFLERGREVMVVRAGDTINGRFIVDEITGEAVKLKVDGVEDEILIDMTEFK